MLVTGGTSHDVSEVTMPIEYQNMDTIGSFIRCNAVTKKTEHAWNLT